MNIPLFHFSGVTVMIYYSTCAVCICYYDSLFHFHVLYI